MNLVPKLKYLISILEGEFTVYDLGVEDNDLYIANGVLTHNK
jgi:intein/homing endonuclease